MSATDYPVGSVAEHRVGRRDVVWKIGGSYFPVNGVLFTPTEETTVTTVSLGGVRELRIADLGQEPNIRINKRMRVACRFSNVKQSTADTLRRVWSFNQQVALETQVLGGVADTLTAALNLSGYADYEWYFGTYRGWKTGTVVVYVDTVAKAAGDATYGWTADLDKGGIQTTTPANWNAGLAVTADYTWAPTVTIDDFNAEPIPSTYPHVFNVALTFQEILTLDN